MSLYSLCFVGLSVSGHRRCREYSGLPFLRIRRGFCRELLELGSVGLLVKLGENPVLQDGAVVVLHADKQYTRAIRAGIKDIGQGFEEFVFVEDLEAEPLLHLKLNGHFEEAAAEAQFGEARGKPARRIFELDFAVGVERKPQTATVLYCGALLGAHTGRIAPGA